MSAIHFIPAAPGFTLHIANQPRQPIIGWVILLNTDPFDVVPVTPGGAIAGGEVRDPDGNVVPR